MVCLPILLHHLRLSNHLFSSPRRFTPQQLQIFGPPLQRLTALGRLLPRNKQVSKNLLALCSPCILMDLVIYPPVVPALRVAPVSLHKARSRLRRVHQMQGPTSTQPHAPPVSVTLSYCYITPATNVFPAWQAARDHFTLKECDMAIHRPERTARRDSERVVASF